MKPRLRSVSEVAQFAGVSVRTLHHYDEIGLLAPSARSDNGYRRYSDDDVRRLLSVLVFKRLGFSLLDVVEEHRAHLEHWFYPCSKTMHRGLGRMYADDPRFASHFEKIRPGLAAFVAAAFEAHAAEE